MTGVQTCALPIFAKNPEHHGQMKHLDLCFYWLRDKVQSNILQPLYLPTEDMPADLLKKALPRPQVLKLQSMMGLVDGDQGVVKKWSTSSWTIFF